MVIQNNVADTSSWVLYGIPIGVRIGKTVPMHEFIRNNATISIPQYRLVIKGSDLYLPQLRYNYIFRNQGGNEYGATEYGTTSIFDVVNPELSNELFSHDTVVVQQGLVKLTKQQTN